MTQFPPVSEFSKMAVCEYVSRFLGVGLVLEFYRIILDTRSVAELCHAAERKKAVSRMCVI